MKKRCCPTFYFNLNKSLESNFVAREMVLCQVFLIISSHILQNSISTCVLEYESIRIAINTLINMNVIHNNQQ